jgi:hypothetical protein
MALLPVSLVGISVVALVHDRHHLSGVPSAVLRESQASGLRWVPEGDGGHFEPDLVQLRVHLSEISRHAVDEAAQGVFKADSISAKACFWIFSVNTRNGALETPIWSECDARGPSGGGLSLGDDLARERAKAQGISLGESDGYVDRVVVTGVVVSAETRHMLDPRVVYHFSKGAIAFARQEVVL